MATADDALKILEKCTLRNARRMRNPGRYNFSIEYGFSEEMNYDKLTGQLESLGFRPLIRNLTTVYTGSDFEVAVRRPEGTKFNFGHAASIAFLLPEKYVKMYEDLHEMVSNR